jgi:glycosyltransferase involved in cell wall biosynthesis
MSRRRRDRARPAALLVTNMNTHYRDGLFRILFAKEWQFVFFSDGGEWYAEHPLPTEHLDARTEPGTWIMGTRIVPSLIPAVLRTRARVVVKCSNGRFAVPAVYLAARLRRRKIVLWSGVWREPDTWAWRLARPGLHLLYRRADAVITYGPHVSRHLEEVGVAPEKMFVATQATDNARFARPVRLRAAGAPLHIVTVARLVPEKGIATLLEALSKLDKRGGASLTIVGLGPDLERLESIAAELGVAAAVDFVGRVEQSELGDLYEAADVVVLPSEVTPQWTEPWGFVVNEALAAGRPLISSDAVGATAAGLVEHGVTGLVFPAGDASALAEALTTVADDPELACRLAAAGQQRVATLTPDSMADAFTAAVTYAAADRRR